MTLPQSEPSPATGITPSGEQRLPPLTNPADIVTLMGRFMACGVLFMLTIFAFVKQIWWLGVGLGVFSLVWQRATTNLWRRLRDERMAAEAARAAEMSARTTDDTEVSAP